MTRIERSAPRASVTAPPSAEAPARRIGRVSKQADSAEKREKQAQMIDNHLKLIAINQNRIDYLRAGIQPEIDLINVEIERLKGVLHDEIVAAKMDGYTDGEWEAKFITEMTRSSREIDPAKVKSKLSDADFLKVVKVQVTNLREFMSEREIDSCSHITPAAPGGTKFVVQPVDNKPKKSRK